MKRPWANKVGLAKAATVFATVLLVSLGLCGLNVIAFLNYLPAHRIWNGFLFIAAWVELGGVVVSVIGILIVRGIQMWRILANKKQTHSGNDKHAGQAETNSLRD